MTGRIPTYAVIPSEGRPCLHDCLAAVRGQVDGIVLVVNGGYTGLDADSVAVVRDAGADRNISRWWNTGLDAVASLAGSSGAPGWNTLILNDDTVMHPGSVKVLTDGLRRYDGAQLAFCGRAMRLLTEPGPDRITGWCFALRGEGGLRADEELVWWCGDNAIDYTARASGGSVIVPGVEHTHLYPNGYTVANQGLNEQAGRDMNLFVKKWGRPAW